MPRSEELDDPRRDFLIRALAAGFFASGATSAILQPVYGMGKIPKELVPGKSVYDVEGRALVNGVQATLDTKIPPNASLETGPDGRLIFAVGKDAFILRGDSKLKLSGNNTIVDTLNLISGRLLSVFGKTTHTVQTTIATIGIRGTGVYVESDPEKSYVCTCYGITDIGSNTDPESKVTVAAQHHDAPKYVLAKGATGKRVVPGPFINHTDLELALIEELVGRTPPFAFSTDEYSAPRKEY
ncbi:MAG: hypothetical protein AAF434_04460 [Pseudomonadota bacterium]